MSNKVVINEKLNKINEFYVPKVVGELNNQYVKLVKLKGPYVMHHHENEDEMFYVIKGSFTMEYKDHSEVINEGEFVIVPKGVDHKPVASEEAHIMLFEPKDTLNTGSSEKGEYTIDSKDLEKI